MAVGPIRMLPLPRLVVWVALAAAVLVLERTMVWVLRGLQILAAAVVVETMRGKELLAARASLLFVTFWKPIAFITAMCLVRRFLTITTVFLPIRPHPMLPTALWVGRSLAAQWFVRVSMEI